MIKYRLALISALVLVFQGSLVARDAEFARVVRKGEAATLSVFGARPVDLAARKLVDEFGVAINIEDPFYMNLLDLEEAAPARAAGSGSRLLAPKPSLLELRLDLNADGSLKDVRKVVQDLVNLANAKLPFQYRIDTDGGVFNLVATRTRDDRGRSVELNPMLDRQVSVALGTRTIVEHVQLLTQALGEQTGFHIDCCETTAGAAAWGSTVISFEARDEMARSALLRLIRNAPPAPQQRNRESGRYSWRCAASRESRRVRSTSPPDQTHADELTTKRTKARSFRTNSFVLRASWFYLRLALASSHS